MVQASDVGTMVLNLIVLFCGVINVILIDMSFVTVGDIWEGTVLCSPDYVIRLEIIFLSVQKC